MIEYGLASKQCTHIIKGKRYYAYNWRGVFQTEMEARIAAQTMRDVVVCKLIDGAIKKELVI